MRFLYGDSAPFPLAYNFLSTLETFMEAATRIVQLDFEVHSLSRRTDEAAQGRLKGLEALEQFHTVVMRAVQDTAQKVQHAHALDYAQQVAGFASHYVEEHRRGTVSANERDATQVKSDNERRTAEQRTLLEGFLKVAALTVHRTKVSSLLVVEGRETRHQMSAVYDNPDGIVTSFTLGTSKVPAWNAPRRVADFVQGVELMVGVDKSWLRGTVSPKQINVDDWIVTQFELTEDAFDVTLRRKLTEKDMLSFRLRRSEAGVTGIVENNGNPTADAINGALSKEDVAALEGLWQAIRLATREVVPYKEQLITVTLDDVGVFEGGLVVPFIVRLVALFGPTVREIAKRSPNEFELSLKMETDAGRREEVYLRKDQLVSKLQPLSSAGRQVFAPLGLDTWVPGTTVAPPPVVVDVDVEVSGVESLLTSARQHVAAVTAAPSVMPPPVPVKTTSGPAPVDD